MLETGFVEFEGAGGQYFTVISRTRARVVEEERVGLFVGTGKKLTEVNLSGPGRGERRGHKSRI